MAGDERGEGRMRARSGTDAFEDRLHATLVPSQEGLAIGALVSHSVQGLDAAWNTGARPQSNDA